MQDELLRLLAARKGHFKLESGHHGDLWLELDLLFLRPGANRPFVAELANRLAVHKIDAVCGPLVGGALIAHIVAAELNVEFYYTEPHLSTRPDALYPMEYRLPAGSRKPVAGKNVAIIDDAINAGSAARGTLLELQSQGAKVAVFGALLVLGTAFPRFVTDQGIPLERLATLSSNLWLPEDCPLCKSHTPLENPLIDGGRN